MSASSIWNALVAVESDDPELRRFAASCLDDLRASAPDAVPLLDFLAARKRALFPHDQRIVAAVTAEPDGDQFKVVALSVAH